MHTFRRNALQAALLLSGCALATPSLVFAQEAAQPATGVQAGGGDQAAAQADDKKKQEAIDLQAMVVTGNIGYRSHIDVPAPVLVYDQQFFAKFEPVSVGVLVKARRTFVELRPMARWEAVWFVLPRRLEHPRIARVLRASAQLTSHAVNARTPDDIDAQVREWLSEAYFCCA